MQSIANPIKIVLYENKGTQGCNIKCENVKEGGEEANSRHENLSRGSECHKCALTSILLKHSRKVSLPGNQVSPADTTTVILIPISIKGTSPRRVVDATQGCRRRSTIRRRVEDMPASHRDSKDERRTEIQYSSL